MALVMSIHAWWPQAEARQAYVLLAHEMRWACGRSYVHAVTHHPMQQLVDDLAPLQLRSASTAAPHMDLLWVRSA